MNHRAEGVLVGRYSIQLHIRGSSGGETDLHKPGYPTATEEAEIAQLHLIIASAMVKRSCFCIYTYVLKWLNRFFIGVNEYDSYEMLTFASWKTKVC